MNKMKIAAAAFTALLLPGVCLAATPLTYGGALDPISGSIAMGVGGVALWQAYKAKK